MYSVYIYICLPHPPGPSFFPLTLTVSLRGQPSAICYLQKQQKKHKVFGRPTLGWGKGRRLSNALFFVFGFRFFFLANPPLPKPNPKQVIQNVCMFTLSVVGKRW